MDPTRYSRSQLSHSSMPYSGYEQSNAIAFSDPWGAARVNPTSASFAPLTSTSMAASADPLSAAYRHNSVSEPLQQMSLNDMSSKDLVSQSFLHLDNSYVPTSYATSYTSQPATTASPMSGNVGTASYGVEAVGADKGDSFYTMHAIDRSREPHPSYTSAASDMDLQYDPSRQRQSSMTEYATRVNPAYSFDAGAMDAGRSMVSLSQQGHNRFSLPHSHRNSSSASSASYYPSSSVGSVSAASSISSAGSYGGYSGYGSIADGTDISSLASNDYDSARPSLPRPSGMIHSQGMPSMIGQTAFMSTFNSRVSSNTQKKHKCKVCDKRFTRPSSLTTHMYSHTGEKPFVCTVSGCGRAFSVVSNLRRHRKVHKHLADSDCISNAGSE